MDAEVIQYILGIFVILVFQKGTKGAGDSFDFTVFLFIILTSCGPICCR